jgi:hypothetical protein
VGEQQRIVLVRPWWARWRNTGVTVDGWGVTVENVVRDHIVPWSRLEALVLTAGGRGERPAIARLRRSDGPPIDVGAIGFIGHRRRVAWVHAVAPVLIRHGVPIVADRAGSFVWRGLRRPAVDGADDLWRVDHATPVADLRRALAEIDGDVER